MRIAIALSMLFAGACVTDHSIELELRPARRSDGGLDTPIEVATYELRLYRLEDGARCPDVATAAHAAEVGRLAHAQSFSAADAMGEAIGEVPRGEWAFAALARDAACGVQLYGCSEVSIGSDAAAQVAIELAPAEVGLTCGPCRECAAGSCSPVDRVCP
jgi:hypothetical protein